MDDICSTEFAELAAGFWVLEAGEVVGCARRLFPLTAPPVADERHDELSDVITVEGVVMMGEDTSTVMIEYDLDLISLRSRVCLDAGKARRVLTSMSRRASR
jgi:hypothetical protein